jgi:hypothetical protein
MQYLLLIYGNENGWETMSEEERGQIFQAYGTYTQELQDSGSMVAGDALEPTQTATTRSQRRRSSSAATTSSTSARSTRRSSGRPRSPARATARSRCGR